MKKIFSIIFMTLLLFNITTVSFAEDAKMNAELTVLTDRQSLNLSNIGEFKVAYQIDNKSLTQRISANATYTLTDEDSNVLWSDRADVTVSAGGIKTVEFAGSVSKYGVHTLKINIKDKNTNEVLTGEVEVSLSKSNIKLNENAGVSAHFAWGSNPNSTIPYLKKMGSKFVRDEIYWEKYLTESGEYVLPEKSDDYINQLIENGMEPVIILNHSAKANASVPADSKEFEKFVEGFGEYVYNLVGDLKGRVTYFEVWNEMNSLGTDYGSKYAKLLKVAYQKAKLANPECKIIGPVTAGASSSFFFNMKLADYNVANYMDILSFHEYGYENAPEVQSYKNTLNECVNKLKSNFGADKEVWLTEMGWSEGYHELTERDTAMYTVRQYLNNDYEKIVDKLFVYTWINQNHENSYEANLGLLNDNLSAKKAYPAMAAMNYFVGGLTADTRSTDADGNYIYRYKKDNNEEVIVLYNANDEKKTISVTTGFENSSLYDMYGNKIKDFTGNTSCNIQVDGAPKYIVRQKAPASMDYRTNTAQIYGRIEGASEYESVMLYVTKPGVEKNDVLSEGSLVYIEQLSLNADGSYGFEFPMYEDAGQYNIYIGYKQNETLLGPVELEVIRDVTGYIGAYEDGNENAITLIEKIKNSNMRTYAKGVISNSYNASLKATLYAAGIKDNRVMWIQPQDKEISGYGEHSIELEFYKELVLDTDEIRLYLWREGLKPITGDVTIIE